MGLLLWYLTSAPLSSIQTGVQDVIALQQLGTGFIGQEITNLIQLVPSSMASSKVSMQT